MSRLAGDLRGGEREADPAGVVGQRAATVHAGVDLAERVSAVVVAGAEARSTSSTSSSSTSDPSTRTLHIQYRPAGVDVEHRPAVAIGAAGCGMPKRVQMLEQLDRELVCGHRHHQVTILTPPFGHPGASIVSQRWRREGDDTS